MLAGDFTAFASPACNGGRQITLTAPFVGNRIAPALMSPTATKIGSYFPVTTQPCGQVTFGFPQRSQEKLILGKADFQKSDRHYSVKGGIEDGVMDEDKLTQSFEYLQDMGARLNTSMKKQASRDGRHKFWRKFGEALSHALKAVDDIASSELKRAVGEEFHEWLFVDDGIFDSLEDRDVNYRKRMETQETKVCLALPV